MDAKTSPGTPKSKRARRVVLFAAMLGLTGVVALVLGEIALRVFPIPGITYHSFYYDPVTGGKSYPGSTLMYRGDDGVLVTHRANSWGFPDVEHRIESTPGTLRIGFFGDSYTQALQVPLESSFFRLIENDLNTRTSELAGIKDRGGQPVVEVETLAFGVSGRSTLQSYLECMNWMQRLDLDYVVYVFVENDPADQIQSLAGSDAIPYAIIAGDSFVVDTSFNDKWGYKTSWWHRLVQRVKSNSLVVSTIEGRVKLLRRYGVKREVTAADRNGGRGGGGTPMAISAWPPELVETGWTLEERVLDKWRRDVTAQGRKFVVMHVPRGEDVIGVPMDRQDSWSPQLHAYCRRHGVPLVDPMPIFVAREKAGQTMYHDHFTPDGHRAFADAFVAYLLGASAAALPTGVAPVH